MGKQDNPGVVRVNDWTLDGNWHGNRSGVSTIGVFLIVLGLFLAAGQLFSEAQVGASAFFLAVGVVLLVVGVRDRSDLALYAGVFVLGLGVMAVALIRSSTGRRITWTLGIGALLALWGGSDVAASNIANFPSDRLIGPLLIVLLGLYVVSRNRR